MNGLRRDFVVPLLIVIVAVLLVGGGIYFITSQSINNNPTNIATVAKTTETSPTTKVLTLHQTFQWVPLSNYSGWKITVENGTLHYSTPDLSNQTIVGADPSSFEEAVYGTGTSTVPLGYFRDSKNVYHWNGSASGEPISQVTGADVATFEVIPNQNAEPGPLSDEFAKDKNHIYYFGDVVSQADPVTFSVLLDSTGFDWGYAKDKNHFYFIDENSGTWVNVIPNVDYATFVVLGNGYAKDKSHVWYNNFSQVVTPPLQRADPATFTTNVQPNCGQNCYVDAQDKNHKYDQGQVVK
jgi:hypothetical protein